MNKPDKQGWWYWQKNEECNAIPYWIPYTTAENCKAFAEGIGGTWLGPVPKYGESFTVPEIEAYLNSFYALCDATFSVDHKAFGIKAFTERNRA